MATAPNNPHDAEFRRVMSRSADAASELRAIVPEAFVDYLDWSTLALLPGSYLSAELRERFTDLLFSAVSADGEDVLVYVLMEHQSRNDAFMALRMLHYLSSVLLKYVEGQAPRPKFLPVLVPIVVHTGVGGNIWSAPVQFHDLFGWSRVDEKVRDFLLDGTPRFRYVLEDVTKVGLLELARRPVTPAVTVMLLIQRIAPGNKQVHIELRVYLHLLRELDADDQYAVFVYLVKTSDTTNADLMTFADRIGPTAKEAVMTTAQQIAAEATAAATVEAEVNLLLAQLQSKFGEVTPSEIAEIRAATRERVQVWAMTFYTAASVEELLAG